LKFTANEHPDYNDLAKALAKIQETMARVNEAIGDAQRMTQLLDIEQKFGFTLVCLQLVFAAIDALIGCLFQQNLIDPARKFVKEGQLGKITSTTLVVRPMYFLFSDILVYGYEGALGGYKWKGQFDFLAVFGLWLNFSVVF